MDFMKTGVLEFDYNEGLVIALIIVRGEFYCFPLVAFVFS